VFSKKGTAFMNASELGSCIYIASIHMQSVADADFTILEAALTCSAEQCFGLLVISLLICAIITLVASCFFSCFCLCSARFWEVVKYTEGIMPGQYLRAIGRRTADPGVMNSIEKGNTRLRSFRVLCMNFFCSYVV